MRSLRGLGHLRGGLAVGLAVGLAMAAGVVFPLVDGGWTLTLDWVSGPGSRVPSSVYGFAVSTAAVPATLALRSLSDGLGGALVSWLAIAACFPVAAVGAARLVERAAGEGGTSVAGRAGAAILFSCNPFVFDRIAAGQVLVLVTYALLPFVVLSLLGVPTEQHRSAIPAVLWTSAGGAVSVHLLWMAVVVVVVVLVVHHAVATVAWAVRYGLGLMACNAYLLVPQLAGGVHSAVGGTADLRVFRTASDATLGLFVNVAGLYGFWRRGPVLAKAHLSGWPILLLAILLVVVIGVRAGWRRGSRDVVKVVVTSSVAGYFLALGDQGPTGPVFRLLYHHLPGFAVMREPEKFSALLALGYAVFFGLGVADLLDRLPRLSSQALVGSLALALPLAYTPTIFGGLDGQLRPSHYPASWSAAERLMGSGDGKILFLPWHEYLSFTFTHGHVVANPAATFFQRPVLAGDNVQVGSIQTESTSTQSAYLEGLFTDGPELHQFGHLVAQLGVSFVVLADAVDYRYYHWLYGQTDLHQVLRTPDLTVWRNEVSVATGTRVRFMASVPSQSAYVRLAQQHDLRGVAVVVEATPTALPTTVPQPLGDVRRKSYTEYEVLAGAPGWVVLPEDGASPWRLAGRSSSTLVDGVIALPASGARATARYARWPGVQLGYEVSGAATVALAAGALWRSRRRARSS